MRVFRGVVLTAVLSGLPAVMLAQANRPAPSVTAGNSAASMSVSPQVLAETVHEAWIESGRSEDKFFDTVKAMAEMSAQKRGVTLPDTEAAGQKMGMLIKTSARRDPDQLLYAVVDAAVRQTAGVSPHAATAKQ